jgi:hypothetical protein
MRITTLMMETEQVSETWNVYSAMTQLIAEERFSEFVCRESFNPCVVLIIGFAVP